MIKLYAALALIALIGAAFWRYDYVVKDRDQLKLNYEMATAAADQYRAQVEAETKRNNEILDKHHDAEAKIEYVDKIVTKEVIRYRDRVVTRVELPADFVRIYNESTESEHKENSTIGTNDSPPALGKIVTDADVLEVSTRNNRACVKYMQRLWSLQDWAEAK